MEKGTTNQKESGNLKVFQTLKSYNKSLKLFSNKNLKIINMNLIISQANKSETTI